MKTFQFIPLVLAAVLCVSLSSCGGGPREKKIEFVYLALGARSGNWTGGCPESS
ncbi:MAG: hypothetical protein K0S58_2843 [Nitrospira sp.]|nr:hypothetical protein [Nitrospira sp.]